MVKELSPCTATSILGHGHGAQPSHGNKHIRSWSRSWANTLQQTFRSWSRSSAFTPQKAYQVMVKEFSLPHCNTTKISGLGQRALSLHYAGVRDKVMVRQISFHRATSRRYKVIVMVMKLSLTTVRKPRCWWQQLPDVVSIWYYRSLPRVQPSSDNKHKISGHGHGDKMESKYCSKT